MARIEGVKQVRQALLKMAQRHMKAAERGIKKAGAYLLGESLELVPVDTGVLRASGWVRVIDGSGFKTKVGVGYTASYAVYVHEDLEARHGEDYNAWHGEDIAAGRKKARGPKQQAKFLEQPLRQHRKQLVLIIVEEMKK